MSQQEAILMLGRMGNFRRYQKSGKARHYNVTVTGSSGCTTMTSATIITMTIHHLPSKDHNGVIHLA
ncbi:MAG: hypothetical protein IPL08_12155 [Saprospiraceae bacterium]|nr:hypothetical protein [Saprospiraceae bacterium]